MMVYGLLLTSFETLVVKENGTQMTKNIKGDWMLNDWNQLKHGREQKMELISSEVAEKQKLLSMVPPE